MRSPGSQGDQPAAPSSRPRCSLVSAARRGPGAPGEPRRWPRSCPSSMAGPCRRPRGRYFPETLFEYIDGAAESYLSYDFRELLVADLQKKGLGGDPDAGDLRHGDAAQRLRHLRGRALPGERRRSASASSTTSKTRP
ncbi:MAG: hypothetical protein MZU95_01910 [Desulfomicrobium escambiense]|nr:hypothetical protein [Desulfomicrobium escambiense]